MSLKAASKALFAIAACVGVVAVFAGIVAGIGILFGPEWIVISFIVIAFGWCYKDLYFYYLNEELDRKEALYFLNKKD